MITKYAIKRVGLSNILKGELPAYAWPGGYPAYYTDSDNNALCPGCATDTMNMAELPLSKWAYIVDADVNWGDKDLYCDECSNRIETAYAED